MVFSLNRFEIVLPDFCYSGGFCRRGFRIGCPDPSVADEQIDIPSLCGDLVNSVLELFLRGYVAGDGVNVRVDLLIELLAYAPVKLRVPH